MRRVNPFVKRIICLLISIILFVSLTAPASAAMVELELDHEDRTVTPVYRRANSRSTVIGYLTDGTGLTVTGETDGFYSITCGGMKGCIPRESVEVDDNGLYYVNCFADADSHAFHGLGDQEYRNAIETVLKEADRHLGTRYRYGGTRPGGFDCSGFVLYVYRAAGYGLDRTASQQVGNGVIVERENLLPGDLVFFRGTGSGAIASHVGIYVGDGMFIHASSSGIRYDALNDGYWAPHYLTARRIVLTGTAAFQAETDTPVQTNRSSDIPVGAFLFLSQLRSPVNPAIITGIDLKNEETV